MKHQLHKIFKTNRHFGLEFDFDVRDSEVRDGFICPTSSLVLKHVNNLMELKTIAADDEET
jgi:hypothetical protein